MRPPQRQRRRRGGSGRDRLRAIAALIERGRWLADEAARIEDESWLVAAGLQPPVEELAAALELADEERAGIENELIDLAAQSARLLTLALYGRNRARVLELARAYLEVAGRHGLEVTMGAVSVRGEVSPGTLLRLPEDPDLLPAGVLLELRGRGARVLLEGEAGLHEWRHGRQRELCLVVAQPGAASRHRPPPHALRGRDLPGGKRRRVHDLRAGRVEDAILGRSMRAGNLSEIIDEAIRATRRARLEELLDS
jgi:hypothetical protein